MNNVIQTHLSKCFLQLTHVREYVSSHYEVVISIVLRLVEDFSGFRCLKSCHRSVLCIPTIEDSGRRKFGIVYSKILSNNTHCSVQKLHHVLLAWWYVVVEMLYKKYALSGWTITESLSTSSLEVKDCWKNACADFAPGASIDLPQFSHWYQSLWYTSNY